MIIRKDLALQVIAAIELAQKKGDLPAFELPEVIVEKPRDSTYGDYACPTAMTMARLARIAPLKIAETIAAYMPEVYYLAEVNVAPPGFINFRLTETFLQGQVAEIISKGFEYANFDMGEGKQVQVEFVSANPTGPLTVGRGRGGVMGDTLARAMSAAGYEVSREYYFNNAGRQMEILGQSLRTRYLQALGQEISLDEDHYQGEYLYWIAMVLVGQQGDSLLEKPSTFFSKVAEESIFASIHATLRRLNIHFDVYFNEYDLYTSGRVKEAMERLKQKGYAYELEGAFWFKSTELGDDKDRVLIKSSGEPTYRMTDIAYHWDKVERGFDLVVDIFGADHHATAPTVMMGLKALGYDPGFVHILLHQFVTLIRAGEQVRMSTRKGHFVTLDELMDEVGADAVRYYMLSRSANSTIDFDMDLAVEQSDKNPVYYIQNAHVRCAGIFRKWAEAGMPADAGSDADLSLLTHENELGFLRKAVELVEVLELMASQFEPHHMAFYAYDLAAHFHTTYETCRVMHSEVPEPLRLARLQFYRAAKQLLARVLGLMGMSAPDVM